MILAVASYLVLAHSGPIIQNAEIVPIPAIAAFLLFISAATVISAFFRFIGRILDLTAATTPTGRKGTSGFIKSLREIKHELLKEGDGPYWGMFKKQPIMADFISNAMTVAPAGAGKGVGSVLPNILSIFSAKIFVDFKGELSCCTKKPLEARGEKLHILNLGKLYMDILGESASYNVLDIVIDNFETPGGLGDVTADLTEMTEQVCPNPVRAEGGGENKYFLEGERDLIAYGIVQNILVHHRDANIGEVSQMMNNVDALHDEARWVSGRLEIEVEDEQAGLREPNEVTERSKGKIKCMMPIEHLPWVANHAPEDVANFIEYHRGTAAALCDLIEATDSRTFDSFITGTRQSLKPFNKTTRAHKVLQKSSFRFAECKEGEQTTSISIVVDASRIQAQMPILGLLQFCAMTEIKRAKDKLRPVYFICDECTQYKIEGLPELLTWGRGFGLRVYLIFQSVSAFVKTYGEEGFNVLWSETEIKQFLPGQREPRILSLIRKLLAERSVIVKDFNGRTNDGFGVDGFGYKEDGQSVMSEDQIRRTDKTLTFIRNNKAIAGDLPPYAAIAPWRDQMDVNPFYGKPFRLPVKLRIPKRFLKKRAKQ